MCTSDQATLLYAEITALSKQVQSSCLYLLERLLSKIATGIGTSTLSNLWGTVKNHLLLFTIYRQWKFRISSSFQGMPILMRVHCGLLLLWTEYYGIELAAKV
jgi:hypothetical protein